MSKPVQQKGGKAPILKSKFGKQLGFRTPDHFKGETFREGKGAGFDPARFKTQHKG
jgi:hypothetical protein